MNIRIKGVSALAVVFGLALSAPASAQAGPAGSQPSTTAASSSSGGDYQWDINGGVNLFNRVLNRGETATYKPGWHVGASYQIIHVISVVTEASGDYDKRDTFTANIYSFSGGVKFESGSKGERIKPFAQLLMGTSMDNGDGTGAKNHYPTVTPGGGVDFRLANHAAARVKLDFPLYATFGDVHKGARLAIGLAVPLGTR